MMKKLVLAILLASTFAMTACSGGTVEPYGDMDLSNDGSYDWYEIYVEPDYSATFDLTLNLLGATGVVIPGDYLRVSVDCEDTYYWDALIVDELAYECEIYDIDPCDSFYDYYIDVSIGDSCFI